ncbi:MAG: RIP metalloprotease RseP [Spirochaetaceae bacterium]|nr:RIP metalloprotease RseP [Spirochaetaceae bacterium]
MSIIWGILCLGFIVFVHELGHFIAARLCGVKVESFSIGMGPVLLHKTIKETDYRISLLPFGGYCGMKGEQAFQKAIEEKLSYIPKEENSFYGVHPLKRAFIAFMGPGMNVLFSVLAFTIIAMTGYTYYSADNRIILANEVSITEKSVAYEAGIKTGDRIVSINDKDIKLFSDISSIVGTNPNETLKVTVIRNNEKLIFDIIPIMDTSTGIGKIGVMNWIDPIIHSVEPNSPAETAGIISGDKILSINDYNIQNTADIQKILNNFLANKQTFPILIERTDINGNISTIELEINLEGNDSMGILFSVPQHQAERKSFFPAIIEGFKETGELISLTFKSIGLLFKGVKFTDAVSGPARITVMLGDTVEQGFSQGFIAGLVSTLNFLALINISLFIMNLLPIPILDGGLILFALIETVIRRQVHPKVIYYTQFIGIAFILLLLGIAIFSDAKFFINGVGK